MTSPLDTPSTRPAAGGAPTGRSVTSQGDRDRGRAFYREFVPAMMAYGLLLVLVLVFGKLDGHSPWRFGWAVLPVVPIGWVLWAVARHLRRVDEMQQRLMLQGLGIGFAASMLASVTAGFLGIAGLDMRFVGWIIYGIGMAGWAIGAAVGAAAAGRTA